MDKIKCQEICDEDDECKFAMFSRGSNKKKRCRKMRACEKMAKADNPVSLFSKDGECPGIYLKESELLLLESSML